MNSGSTLPLTYAMRACDDYKGHHFAMASPILYIVVLQSHCLYAGVDRTSLIATLFTVLKNPFV